MGTSSFKRHALGPQSRPTLRVREIRGDETRDASNMARWNFLGFFCFCGLVDLLPSVVNRSTVNLLYVATSLFCTVQLSPWHTLPENASLTSVFVLAFIRIPAVVMPSSPVLVTVCNILPIGVIILRAGAGDVPLDFIVMEISGFLATMSAAAAVQLVLHQRAEHSVQYTKMACDLKASSSLLHLTCDAVIELNDKLQMTEHVPTLAIQLSMELQLI